jgi:hypothetical protein
MPSKVTWHESYYVIRYFSDVDKSDVYTAYGELVGSESFDPIRLGLSAISN